MMLMGPMSPQPMVVSNSFPQNFSPQGSSAAIGHRPYPQYQTMYNQSQYMNQPRLTDQPVITYYQTSLASPVNKRKRFIPAENTSATFPRVVDCETENTTSKKDPKIKMKGKKDPKIKMKDKEDPKINMKGGQKKGAKPPPPAKRPSTQVRFP